jgi:hypothetical protein
VKLITLSPEILESEERLPFDVFDAQGKLLLASNEAMGDPDVRRTLQTRGSIHAEAAAVADWRRRVAERVDELVRRNAPLSAIAKARATRVRESAGSEHPGEEWEALVYLLDAALREPRADQPWVQRVRDVQARLRELTARRMDEALFHYIHTGSRHADHYSSHQALRCMLVAGEVARELGFSQVMLEQLDLAALSMNVAMRRLQDRLAVAVQPQLDEAMRARIAQHGADSAQMLQAAGVADAAWLEAVRLHHDASLEHLPSDELTDGQRIAQVLRRVDIYCAKISRRAGRVPLTAMQAAAQACLGPDGRPDRIGAALLKALGLYPPGCFVQLASGERGIVLARGTRADQPLVAVLVDARRAVLMGPRLRDTSQAGGTVRTALRPDQVAVQPSPHALQALHTALRTPGQAGTAAAAFPREALRHKA